MEEIKMAKLTTEEFIAAIKELSVVELNDLVKAVEEEFGVSAAAGVVVAAGAAAAGWRPGASAASENGDHRGESGSSRGHRAAPDSVCENQPGCGPVLHQRRGGCHSDSCRGAG